jgi:O-antigen ligase
MNIILVFVSLVVLFYYILLCIIKPFAAFYILVFLGLMSWFSSIPLFGGFSVIVGVGLVFTGAWITRILLDKTKVILLREYWLLWGLLLVIGLSTLINWGGPAGLGSVFTYLQLLLLVVLVVNFVQTSLHLRALGYLFIITSVFVAMMMLLDEFGVLPVGIIRSVQYGVVFEGNYNQFERSGGIFGDPNFTALQLLVAVPFVLEFWKGASRWQKIILAFSGVVILSAFRLTYSMGGVIGLAMILLVKTFFMGKRNRIIPAVQAILIGFIGWWLALNFLPEYYWARILINFDLINNFVKANDPQVFLKLGTTRGDTWTAAYKTFLQSPLFGLGPGNAVYFNPLHSVYNSNVRVLAAHNFLLTVADDLGIVGLFLFVTLLIFTVRAFWSGGEKQNPVNNAVFVALLASMVQGLALDIHTQKFLWILMGMSFAAKKIFKTAEIL